MTKKIIWADDNYDMMKRARPIFKSYGFTMILCDSISKALKEILRGRSGNLLLDVDFPESPKEGLIFLEGIRAINPALRVVLFTGFPEYSDAVMATRKLLALDYIPKPIPINKIKRDFFFKKLHEAFSSNPGADAQLKLVKSESENKIAGIHNALNKGDIKSFMTILQAIFAGISYNVKANEGYYHGYIQIILDLAGINVISEKETNMGRIDAVAETESFIYIMEFKLSDPVIALEQILTQKYYQRYLTSRKQIILVGISFNGAEKNISGYKVKRVKMKN